MSWHDGLMGMLFEYWY